MVIAEADVKIHHPVNEISSGRAIVVFPGWTNDVELILEPVQATLCQFGDVIGVQPMGIYDPELIARRVFEDLYNYSRQEVVLIGCSLGAMAAVDFIRRYAGASAPFKIKIVLECGVVSVEDVRRGFQRLVKYGSPILRGEPLLDRFWPHAAEWFFKHDKPIPLEIGEGGHDPILLERHHYAMWHCPTRLSMSQLRALRSFSPLYPGELKNIPTSIIAYQDDQMVEPSALLRQMEATWPSFDLVIQEGYGHDDWVERPEQANKVLLDALSWLCQPEPPSAAQLFRGQRIGTRLTKWRY